MIRRIFLQVCTTVAVILPLLLPRFLKAQPLAATEEGEPVTFRWRVPVAHLETVQQSLSYEGRIEREKDTKGAWVFVFVGVALLPYVAKSILELMRQVEHGGVIIDACGPEVEIDTNKQMPHGMIIVRNCKDVDLKVYWDEIEGPSQLVDFMKEASEVK
jgi:hypothetical protein